MKFTLSTKPFSDALDLGVINSNVSKFYSKSCLIQLTADARTLLLNLEASGVTSQISLRGSGDSDSATTVFVDCVLLKQLVHTFEASTTTLDFHDDGLTIHSGSAKFTLPKMIDAGEMELTKPGIPGPTAASVKIDPADWKFIQDNQMYAIAMSFIHPVYTKVWVSETSDVMVSDYDRSLFTFSTKSKLGRTCLLSDTIIHLMNSLPSGATCTQLDKSYRIDVKTDAFEYCAEFTPQYEDDPGVGSYNAPIFFDMLADVGDESFTVAVSALSKFLSQAGILSSSSDDSITVSLDNSKLCLCDKNVDCKIDVTGSCSNFKVDFNTALLTAVLSHLDAESVSVTPLMQDGVCGGLVFKTQNITTVLGGLE